MNIKFLNFIIGFSLLGITLIFISDYLSQSKTRGQPVVFEPTIAAVSPMPTSKPDPLTFCQNDFFNFQKGTSWRYKLGWGDKKKIYFFTNKIIEASTSSASIDTKFDNDNNGKITKLICRKSGITGFPYPLFPPQETVKLKIDDDIFFLPPTENLKSDYDWKSYFKTDPGIPFVDKVVIEFENKLIRGGTKLSFGKQRNTASVEAYLKKIKLPIDILKPQKEPLFKFQLLEDIGISHLELNFSQKEVGSVKSEMTLVNFTPGSTSSSQ